MNLIVLILSAPLKKIILVELLILGCLTVMSGCSPLMDRSVEWRHPGVDLVWPLPPDQPRLRYLRSVAPEDFLERTSGFERFGQWFTGNEKQFAPLITPFDITADGNGRIWVADPGSQGVHLFDLEKGRHEFIRSFGDQVTISPVGVAYDPSTDRLYVADSAVGKIFTISVDKTTEAFSLDADFGRPGGLAVSDKGDLYVADVLKGTIEVFDREGGHLATFRGGAFPEEGFNRPIFVDVDHAGRIYVTDSMHFQVEILSSEGKSLASIGTIGAVPGSFARPRGVAVDSDGHIYVVDAAFGNIQIFDSKGRLLLFFGSPGKNFGEFNLPAGLFCDQNDILYVVDVYNHRIQIFQYISD